MPRWGPVAAGAWATYVVSVRNEGATDIAGEVVLAPRPVDEPGDVAVVETAGPPARAMDYQFGLTAPPVAAPQRWPVYRVPLLLASGSTKTVTVVAVEAPGGHEAELRDTDGGVLATQEPAPPAAGLAPMVPRLAVAVLGRVDGDLLTRGAPIGSFRSHLEITRIGSVADFPDAALALSGLQVVVASDADLTAMSTPQVEALEDFVSFGGVLVLGGGAGAQRTLDALPEALVPLRPTGTATAPVGELANPPMVGAEATVITGEVGHGRVVRAQDGRPLVIEAAHGSGYVLQLTYNPLAEPFATEPALGLAGLEAGLAPAFDRLLLANAPAPEALWWPALGAPPRVGGGQLWSVWPLSAIVAAAGYVVLFGPLLLAAARRRRDLPLAAIPLLALAAVGSVALAVPGQSGDEPRRRVVEVDTFGPRSVLLDTYAGLSPVPTGADAKAGRAGRLPATEVGGGTAASSVFAEPWAHPDPYAVQDRRQSISGGFGRPAAVAWSGFVLTKRSAPEAAVESTEVTEIVGAGDGALEVRPRSVAPGQVGTVRTRSIRRGQDRIDASLGLAGDAAGGSARLLGTIENHTGRRLTSVMVLGPELTWARVPGTLKPGARVDVDVLLVPDGTVGGDVTDALSSAASDVASSREPRTEPVPAAEAAMVGVARRLGPRAGQAVVVALWDDGDESSPSTVSIAATVVPLSGS